MNIPSITQQINFLKKFDGIGIPLENPSIILAQYGIKNIPTELPMEYSSLQTN